MYYKLITFVLSFKNKIMKFKINLTWSKIMALFVLAGAVYLDIETTGTSTFMYALPFVVFLITGKQFIDKSKPIDEKAR